MSVWGRREIVPGDTSRPNESLSEDFERALREACPLPESLSQARADQILVNALSCAQRLPRRTAVDMPLAGGLVLSGFALIVGLLFGRTSVTRRPDSVAARNIV